MDFNPLQKLILQRLKLEIPEFITYHNCDHTVYVLKSAIFLAVHEGVQGEHLTLIKTAALLHDFGFVKDYRNHEQISCDLALDILVNFNYSKAQIARIQKMILSTKLPQQPKDHLSKILCDADLYYLGGAQYEVFADRLYQEFKFIGTISDEDEWKEVQVKFLQDHKYFTETAQKFRQNGKVEALKRLKDKVV